MRDRPDNPDAADLTMQGWALINQVDDKQRLDRRDDLDTIHRHVANLVLATGPTPVPSAHKAAPLGRVRGERVVVVQTRDGDRFVILEQGVEFEGRA